MPWLIVSVLAWGLWAVALKVSVDRSDPWSAAAASSLTTIPLLAAAGLWFQQPKASALLWGVAAGIFGLIGLYGFLRASQATSGVTAVGFTALYPAIAVIGFLLMGEPVTTRQYCGILLAVIAGVLLA